MVKYLSPDEIVTGVKEFANISQGIKVALIGGAALQQYGSSRLTPDLDFATTPCTEQGLAHGVYSLRTSSGIPVDLYVNVYEYKDLFEDSVNNAVIIAGLAAPVASSEHMVALKMASGRGKDLVDLDELLLSGYADYAKARSIVSRFMGIYAAHKLDYIYELAKWRRETGRE